jgi:hypothetical protein
MAGQRGVVGEAGIHGHGVERGPEVAGDPGTGQAQFRRQLVDPMQAHDTDEFVGRDVAADRQHLRYQVACRHAYLIAQ